jgi:leucyl-tRNA synthetase
MSKSRGNVVIPDEYIARRGADTFRMYLPAAAAMVAESVYNTA